MGDFKVFYPYTFGLFRKIGLSVLDCSENFYFLEM